MAGLSVSPVNASPYTSRYKTHDSGSRRFATPFLYRTFTDYHLPVCAGAQLFGFTATIAVSLYVPTQHMVELMKKAAERVPADRLWVNPDCGLKTRQWDGVIPALTNMEAAAKTLRATTA